MTTKKTQFYFVVSAAAAASVGVAAREAAAITCLCVPPSATHVSTQMPTWNSAFNTGVYYGYLSVDTTYGFKTATAPQVWFDWENQDNSDTVTAQVCKTTPTGSSTTCGPPNSATVSGAGTYHEITLAVNGTYGATNSVWNRYFIALTSSMDVAWLAIHARIPIQDVSW